MVGIEILSPHRKNVLLDGLLFPADVARVVRSAGFRVIGRSSASVGEAPTPSHGSSALLSTCADKPRISGHRYVRRQWHRVDGALSILGEREDTSAIDKDWLAR